jgi:hypothetical protein
MVGRRLPVECTDEIPVYSPGGGRTLHG